MTRFTLPALGMVAAVAILVAGAFADLPTWRRNAPAIAERSSDTLTAADLTTPHDRSQPVATSPLADDCNQRQARDFQATIAQETGELAVLRTSMEEMRRDLAALRQQREQDQAALARTEAAQSASNAQSIAAARPSAPAVATTAALTTPAVATGVGQDAAASSDVRTGKPVAPDQRRLAATRLEAARAALTAGRRARARWLPGRHSDAGGTMAIGGRATHDRGAVLEKRGNRHRSAQSG